MSKGSAIKTNGLHEPFYDPTKSYQENFTQGPFGAFAKADKTVDAQKSKEFMGQSVASTFGIPAGPLLNARFVTAAFRMGFDLCVYKTVRSQEYPCHPHPNVLAVKHSGDLTLKQAQGKLVANDTYEQPLSITNSFGVPSMNPDFWQADMRSAVESAGTGQICIGSFQGTKRPGMSSAEFIADHVTTARLVKETGTQIMEVNLSCPNEGTSDLLCFDIDRVQQIAHAIKSEIGDTPFILKLAYFEDENQLKKMITTLGNIVQGFSVINTIPATIVDEQGNQALPGEGRARSGVCGTTIKWAGLDMVSRVNKIRTQNNADFSIIGVGGVMNQSDYESYITAGADAVMSATGAMWNPYLAQEIKNT